MTETDIPTHEMVLQLLNRSVDQNEQIIRRLDNSDRKLDQHMLEEESVIKGLNAAFPRKPDGSPDYEGHEVFHTALIEESRARASFYRDLQHDLIKKGVWGVVMIIVALVAFWWNGQVPHK